MKKPLVLFLSTALVLASFAAPATAGAKKKKIHETFPVIALPYPDLEGCIGGIEDVNWVGQEFKAPFSGTLRFWIEGITGDWDIYLFEGDSMLSMSQESQLQGGPPGEEIIYQLKKNQQVVLVVCNWSAEPQTTGHYELTG